MKEIYSQFRLDGRVISCTRTGGGHINNTYLLVTARPHLYILQWLNGQIFRDVKGLMGNVIAAIKKVKINLVFSILSGVLDVCLNLLLIPVLGSAGAAIATLTVTAFIAVLDVSYVVRYLKKAE